MTHRRKLPLLVTRLSMMALMIASSSLVAQSLGSAFTYQGQLKELGQPASGLYDLQVCLFDGPSDPIPLACAPDFNDVPVEGGLFAITLDFGSAPFIGQQRYLELRVRPGASGSGYTILAPRQLVRPAPEALRANVAGAAPWSGLTGMPAGFADGVDNDTGTVTSIATGAGLTGGPVTGSGTIAVAPGGIGAALIDPAQVQSRVTGNCVVGQYVRAVNQDGTVDCGVDANSGGSVTSIATGAGLTGGPITETGTIAVAPGGIGATQINSAQVQLRVAGACAIGQTIAAINADGGVQCVGTSTTPRQSVHPLTISSTRFVSTAVDSAGNPVVVTSYNTALNIFRCQNTACSTLPALTSLATAASQPDVAVGADGTIRVGFNAGQPNRVQYVECGDSACAISNDQIFSGVGLHYMGPRGMALNSLGLPAFVASDSTNQTLMFRRCLNSECSSLGPQQVIVGAPAAGASIAFRADGRPVIASQSASISADLGITRCDDPDCASYAVTSSEAKGISSDIIVPADDRPIVVSLGSGFRNLFLHRCDTPACTSITTRQVLASSSVLLKPRVWINGQGLPVIAFGGGAPGRWQVASCSDMNCNTAGISNVAISYTSEADASVGMDGFPFVAGQNDNGSGQELQVVKCYSAGCE